MLTKVQSLFIIFIISESRTDNKIPTKYFNDTNWITDQNNGIARILAEEGHTYASDS